MSTRRSQWWAAVLVACMAGQWLIGCTGRKQVPFGLEDAGTPEEHPETEQATPEPSDPEPSLPVGTAFAPDQVEVPVGESVLVLTSGYALTALQVDLDGTEPLDALVVSADPRQVWLQAAHSRGLSVAARQVDSFLVPDHCREPTADARQLSPSLAAIRVEHACETGPRRNYWLVTIEAQPRVRERITVLPPTDGSDDAIGMDLSVEDRDGDGYEDVLAMVEVGGLELPLTWLNRPGGFARDPSEPERTLKAKADEAWESLSTDAAAAERKATQVLNAFVAVCRESGIARLGLSGTQGLQCQRSEAAARAVAAAMTAALRQGAFVRALELQRWSEQTRLQLSAEDLTVVQSAWRKAKASTSATWRLIDTSSAPVSLQFADDDTLIIDGSAPRSVGLSSGVTTKLSAGEVMPPVRDPSERYAVRAVRSTCAGFEAEIGLIRAKPSHRVLIEPGGDEARCSAAIDRPAGIFEWAVLGWAPQGLVAATGDLLRVVPLNDRAKPAGRPIELSPKSPLPAPIRGSRVTADGSRYVIPHPEGIVVRDWRKGGSGLWLRPKGWDQATGELRSVAISPDGTKVAVQKGTEIRLLTW